MVIKKNKKRARACVRVKLNLHVPQRKLKLNRLDCFDSPTAYLFIVMIFDCLPENEGRLFIAVTAIIAIVHKTKRNEHYEDKKKICILCTSIARLQDTFRLCSRFKFLRASVTCELFYFVYVSSVQKFDSS